ncbi:hypothetical protein Raf01_49420 [Rugosimonospora africana]|uniref:Uncharacterized protein n=1 Tax=Rugosimonospora africana TaxID=556532 RepID=A0A8J3QSQ8_9ACTN|nr:hypothetical protein Raf01_49420 [Rugosimonospora africana]
MRLSCPSRSPLGNESVLIVQGAPSDTVRASTGAAEAAMGATREPPTVIAKPTVSVRLKVPRTCVIFVPSRPFLVTCLTGSIERAGRYGDEASDQLVA